MRWKLVHTYINDLSYNYIHSYRMFLNTYYNSISHSTNDQYCTREVLRRFPLAIYRLYTMNLPTNANGIQIVYKTNIFFSLLDVHVFEYLGSNNV